MFTRKLIASAVAAATLAGGGLAVAALNPLSSAGAQEHTATTTPDPSTSRTAHPRCAERRHRMNRRDVVKLVADTIHIPVEDLVAELKDGTSIAEVAQAHHVDPKTVTDAIVARGTQRIDQAVARGDLDATRAAKLKARLPQLAERIVNHKRSA